MEIEYTLTVTDVVALNRRYARHTPSARRSIQKVQLAFLLLFLFLAVTMWPLSHSWVFSLAAVAVGVAMAALYPAVFDWQLQRKVALAQREGLKAALFASRRLAITDEGLLESSQSGESRVPWGAVERIDETATHVFIYAGAAHVFAISRASLESATLDAFVAAARRCWSSATAS